MKIIVSVFNNLYTDQRVEKVCKTLYDEGYELLLIGTDWQGVHHMERPYPFHYIPLKASTLRYAYLEFQYKLYRKLLSEADENTLLLANDLDTLWPNHLVAKKLNISLVFDSHEIYTEMPSLEGRFVKKIWKFLEKRLVPKVKYMMTESQSYADWFQNVYGVKPVVIRNIPRRITDPISFPENNPKIILYQGVVNQSRGLAQAIEAMQYLEGVLFKIIGDGLKRQELQELVIARNLEHKVQFLGRIEPFELRKYTQTADVGLSLEENGGLSYLYSLPNKVSDYIQARVPLVMINFPEMKRIKEQFNVGEMVENHEPKNIAEKITVVLERGRAYYEEELLKAGKVLCWENEEEKIRCLFQKAEAGEKAR